jgi:hypothetical protein
MNLRDFRNYIDARILDRGREYYQEGRVSEPFLPSENEYIFTIDGSDYYEVRVQLTDNGEILDSECNCPFDYGPICKHETAVFFALEKSIKNKSSSNIPEKGLDFILQGLSKDELVEIIKQQVSQNPKLEQNLVLKYGQNDPVKTFTDCKKIIKSIISRYKGRTRFIDYKHSFDFANELEEVLELANSINDKIVAVEIAILLFTETVKSLEFTDDSSGVLGSLIRECLTFIEFTISENADSKIDNKLFSILLTEVKNPALTDWFEFKIDIIEICLELLDDEQNRTQLVNFIEQLLIEVDGERFYKELLHQVSFKVIEKYDPDEKALEFIKANQQYSSFREKLIEKLIEQEKYTEIIELCLEAEKQDSYYLGLTRKWKHHRYTAYKNSGQTEQQKKLVRELLFDGEFDFYSELKSLFINEWDSYYLSLINELKSVDGWRANDILVKIIVFEKDYAELLAYVIKHPMQIEEYAKLLAEKYKNEATDLYLNYLRKLAQTSTNRREYKVVCKSIKKFRSIADKEITNNLISELKSVNNRRPAFIDELEKL